VRLTVAGPILVHSDEAYATFKCGFYLYFVSISTVSSSLLNTSVGILYNSIKLQDILFQYLLYLDPSETQGQSPVNAAPTGYLQSPAANQSANDLQVCATSLERGFY
jgi:hypothetical protein